MALGKGRLLTKRWYAYDGTNFFRIYSPRLVIKLIGQNKMHFVAGI